MALQTLQHSSYFVAEVGCRLDECSGTFLERNGTSCEQEIMKHFKTDPYAIV